MGPGEASVSPAKLSETHVVRGARSPSRAGLPSVPSGRDSPNVSRLRLGTRRPAAPFSVLAIVVAHTSPLLWGDRVNLRTPSQVVPPSCVLEPAGPLG